VLSSKLWIIHAGAASVPTVLNEFYGYSLTEKNIFDAMEQDGTASFEDLANVVTQYGFKGGGIALSFKD
jgi:predicted double-glycine peptidase